MWQIIVAIMANQFYGMSVFILGQLSQKLHLESFIIKTNYMLSEFLSFTMICLGSKWIFSGVY